MPLCFGQEYRLAIDLLKTIIILPLTAAGHFIKLKITFRFTLFFQESKLCV